MVSLITHNLREKVMLTKRKVVICSAVRTAITKGRKGGFKDTCPEELLAAVLDEAAKRAKVDKKLVTDIAVGNVLPRGGGATVARMAQLAAGFPESCSIYTLNRQCSSGLTAVNNIASAIAVGQIDIGIGAGVESMTQGYGAEAMPPNMSEKIMDNEQAADCLLPMGITSENVAEKYGVSRKVQDEFAAKSFQKAAAAQKAGKFKDEIVPVTVKFIDPKTEEEKEITITEDEGIRDGVTAESLGKLKPAFSKTGSTTAGNASQVSDGAAAVVLARRSVAKKLGMPILGRFVAAAVVGVEPKLMGIGPAFAIPAVLKKTGLSVGEVDLFEVRPICPHPPFGFLTRNPGQRGLCFPSSNVARYRRHRLQQGQPERRRHFARTPARVHGRPSDRHRLQRSQTVRSKDHLHLDVYRQWDGHGIHIIRRAVARSTSSRA